MRAYLAVGFVAIVFALTNAGIPAYPGDGEKKAVQPPAKRATLEELQHEALKNSQDVKVFEAKLRLAEAELERARAIVKAQVATAHTNLRAAEELEKEAGVRYKRAEDLYRKGAGPAEDRGAAWLTYKKYESERISAQERLKLMLGGVTIEKTEAK